MTRYGYLEWYKVVRSFIGDYWQVRVRAADGREDTVDRAYTLEEAQGIWDRLQAEGMAPLSDRPA